MARTCINACCWKAGTPHVPQSPIRTLLAWSVHAQGSNQGLWHPRTAGQGMNACEGSKMLHARAHHVSQDIVPLGSYICRILPVQGCACYSGLCRHPGTLRDDSASHPLSNGCTHLHHHSSPPVNNQIALQLPSVASCSFVQYVYVAELIPQCPIQQTQVAGPLCQRAVGVWLLW